VRLPKSCRFREDQNQVIARRVGKQVILEPADEWPRSFFLAWAPGTMTSPSRRYERSVPEESLRAIVKYLLDTDASASPCADRRRGRSHPGMQSVGHLHERDHSR